jgi:hypothetical protein
MATKLTAFVNAENAGTADLGRSATVAESAAAQLVFGADRVATGVK